MRSLAAIISTLIVSIVAGVTLGIALTFSHARGTQISTSLRFLAKPSRPSAIDAAVSIPIEYALDSRRNEQNDVVFFGESACRCGIDPVHLWFTTGLRSRNLGSLGLLGPEAQEITARAYFERHESPRLAVLCLLPFSLEFETDLEVTNHFVETYGPEVAGMNGLDRYRYFVRTGASGIDGLRVPTDDPRYFPLEGMPSENYWGLMAKIDQSRGFFPFVNEHGPLHDLASAGRRAAVRPDWDAAVRQIADMCAEHGIKLLIVFMPMLAETRKTQDFSDVEAWTKRVSADCPNVIVAAPTFVWHEAPDMYDDFHLNAAGVAKFMPVVAKDVTEALKR
jgi:hypothetical protein